MTVRTSGLPPIDARAGAERTRLDLCGVCWWFRMGHAVIKAANDINLRGDEAAFVVVQGAPESRTTALLNLIGALDAPTTRRIME